MTLGQFAVAVGASKRWILNAFRVLGIRGGYTIENARRLAFANALKQAAGLPLTRGFPLADDALAAWPHARQWTLRGDDGAVRVTVDLERFLSDFHVRLSLARCWYAEKRRGRPPKRRKRGLAWAREHGVDTSLLAWSLSRTPEQRLRALDEEVEALRRLDAARP